MKIGTIFSKIVSAIAELGPSKLDVLLENRPILPDSKYATTQYCVIQFRQIMTHLKENEESFKMHLVTLLWLDLGANGGLQNSKKSIFPALKSSHFSP